MGNFSLFAAMACTAMMSSSSSLPGTTNVAKLEQGVVGCHCIVLVFCSWLSSCLPIAYLVASLIVVLLDKLIQDKVWQWGS
jgi:hypothetical protein